MICIIHHKYENTIKVKQLQTSKLLKEIGTFVHKKAYQVKLSLFNNIDVKQPKNKHLISSSST